MKTILALIVLAATGARAEPIRAFDAREQAHWHEESRSWYVSNLGGGVLQGSLDGMVRVDARGSRDPALARSLSAGTRRAR